MERGERLSNIACPIRSLNRARDSKEEEEEVRRRIVDQHRLLGSMGLTGLGLSIVGARSKERHV